jgi:hypothetical protein
MKSTTRRTLAAVITGVAAAFGAATPAAAAPTVPVPVPLGGAETSLGRELPEIGAAVPLLTPGTPDGPRYGEGRLLPDRAVPQLPVRSVPGLDVETPLTAPDPGSIGLPGPELPEAGVLAPAVQAAPGASLGLAARL